MGRLLQRLVLAIIANALALYVVQYFLEDQGFLITKGVLGFALVGAVLGILNTIIKPLLKLVSFPFMLVSMGLFLIVINAVMLFFTEYIFNSVFADIFEVTFTVGEGIWSYLLAALLLSIANTVTHWLLKRR